MRSVLLLIAALVSAVAAAPARADDDAAPGALIVRLAPSERAEVHKRAGVRAAGRIPGLPGVDVVVAADGDGGRALAALRADPDVTWAEPVRTRTAFAGDALLPQQWGLANTGQRVWSMSGVAGADIDAAGAWATARGAGVSVAVVDSGIAAAHPDLAPQLTGNPGERGGGRETNHADDDGNGLVDDWSGWDYVANDNAPEDGNGHGTHVAGTAAAAAEAGDVVGVAPEARVLPLRVLDDAGSGSSADVAAAFAYAGMAGARVVNASLGSSVASQAERDAIHAYPHTLYVVAAGNSGKDAGTTYPCAYDEPNVLCVGASDPQDRPAPFSNFSATAVDLFAPGVDIVSSHPAALPSEWVRYGGSAGYEIMNGTSMAAPHAAGAVALVASAHPTWAPARIKRALMESVDAPAALAGLAVTAGRLDAGAAVAWTPPDGEPEPAPVPVPGPAYVALSPPGAAPPAADPVPAAPAPAPVPAPAAVPRAAAAPVVSGLRIVGRPRACRTSCGSSGARLTFTAAPGGAVRLIAERRVDGRFKRVGARTVTVAAGPGHIRVGTRLAGARLRRGVWRVTLAGARVAFRVR